MYLSRGVASRPLTIRIASSRLMYATTRIRLEDERPKITHVSRLPNDPGPHPPPRADRRTRPMLPRTRHHVPEVLLSLSRIPLDAHTSIVHRGFQLAAHRGMIVAA